MRGLTAAGLVAAATLSVPIPATAQERSPAPLAQRAAQGRPLSGTSATIAAGESTVVAWVERVAGAARVLGMARSDAAPRPLGPEPAAGRIVRDGAPTSTAATDGSVWIVAARQSESAETLWAQRWTTGGWQTAVPGPGGRQRNHHPAIAAAPAGTAAWVVWIGEDDGNRAAATLFASRWTGRRWTAAEPLPRVFGAPMAPSITVDRSGEPLVVWAAGDGSDAEIWLSRRRNGRWTAPFALSRNDVPDIMPAIATAGGNVLVAWMAYTDLGYLPRVRSGTTVEALGAAVDLSDEPGSTPAITEVGGRAMALWRRVGGATETEIRARSYGDEAWGAAEAFVAASGSPFAVAGTSRGRLMLAWTRPDGGLGVIEDATPMARRPAATSAATTQPTTPLPVPAAAPDVGVKVPEFFTAFGDSITNGVVYDPDRRTSPGYLQPLQKALRGFFGFGTLFNAGVDGELTADGVGRIDNTIVSQDPDAILIMEGTNDIVNAIDVDTIAFNLRRMVQRSFEEKPQIFPFLAQIPPRLDPGPDGFDGSGNDEIDAVNAMLPAIAQQEGATVVDQNTPLDGNPQLMSNPLHPSVAGYQVMADAWYADIKPVLLSVTNRGDADGSGRTDGIDLVLLALAFGSMQGEPRYNMSADVNRDGIVDGFDLSILVEFFGLLISPTP